MSKLVEEFEKIRYYDDSLTDTENAKRREKRKELLKKMSEEEFKAVIQNTGNIQAKIAYTAERKQSSTK